MGLKPCPIKLFDDTNTIIYPSIREACRGLNCCPSDIYRILNGKRKTIYGYKVERVNK